MLTVIITNILIDNTWLTISLLSSSVKLIIIIVYDYLIIYINIINEKKDNIITFIIEYIYDIISRLQY